MRVIFSGIFVLVCKFCDERVEERESIGEGRGGGSGVLGCMR